MPTANVPETTDDTLSVLAPAPEQDAYTDTSVELADSQKVVDVLYRV
jgi:hypothetical protein